MRVRALVLVVLVVLAGCGGQSASTSPTTPGGSTTETVETSAPPENPWGAETVTVAVDSGAYSDDGYVDAVRAATEYWASHVEASPYEMELEFAVDAANPEIRVTYDSRIQTCGGEVSTGTYYYCTDTYAAGETEPGTSTVELAGGFTEQSTRLLATEAFTTLLDIPASETPTDYREVEQPVNRDPWPQPGNITVGVNQSLTERNMTPLVEQAISYWEQVNRSSKNYTADFTVAADAAAPDIVVAFQHEVDTCGVEVADDIVGCAPTLDTQSRVYETETIEIETGYTNESTLNTLKHEFGHVYGRLHGQSPMPLMNATFDTVHLPVTDATEAAYPWQSTNLTVAVDGDLTNIEDDQVSAALSYFEAGAGGLLAAETPTFTRIQDQSAADIVITVADDDFACGDDLDGGSCGEVYGYSTDADDALEYYSAATITLADIDEDNVAWHVGRWLSYAFGATADEYPEPLDNEHDDRDSVWWK